MRYRLTAAPNQTNRASAFLRRGPVSSFQIAYGRYVGQSTWAMSRKPSVAADWSRGYPSESQRTPSKSCWMPNMSGTAAIGRREGVPAFFRATAPAELSAPPAMKLAVAEKHIVASVWHVSPESTNLRYTCE